MIRQSMVALSVLAAYAVGAVAIPAQVPAQAPAKTAAPSGTALFQKQCALCHLDRGFGTRVLARRVPEGQATLEARKDLSADYVSTVVRRGIGSMPQFRKSELSDADLHAIATYLEKGK